MAEKKLHTFVMSDESLNAYGFRILTDGIDLTNFKKNPVAFWNHKSDDRYAEEDYMPVGKWVNLRKDKGQLLGDLDIDLDDPRGVKLDGKIKNGYVCACSVEFDPHEFSESPEHLVMGQTLSTVSKCSLVECSPVGKPGNFNAVVLKLKGGGTISLNSQTKTEELKKIVPSITTLNNSNMTKDQLLMLGLPEDATEQQITTALSALKASVAAMPAAAPAANPEATKLTGDDAEELKRLRGERVTKLVKQGIADKKFTEAESETYTKLANLDFEGTEKAINAMQPVVKLSSALKTGIGGGTGTGTGTATKVEECEFYKLSKNSPAKLEELQRTDEPKFKELMAEYQTLLKNR